jgi:outer membrane lipoprotein LolB
VSATFRNRNRSARRAQLAAVTVAAVLVSGCATRQGIQLPDLSSWEQRSRVLGSAEDWEFSGRIGVRASDDGFNGKLRWRQDGVAFTATVGGPLGIGTVRIAGDGDGVALTDKDGETTVLSDVERDLYNRYGWTIPVASLRYWALGIPDPGAPARTEFGADGRLARLEQRAWSVTISDYREAAGQPMPFRLSASSADTRVRIVIDHWRFYE